MTSVRSSVFAETYTPTEQRDRAADDDEGWLYDYIGRLRLDSVAFRTITIPDSHLLDGAFFFAMNAEDLLSSLKRVPGAASAPLVVRTRADGIEQSLIQLLVRDERLNNFPFNTIPDTHARAALASTLRTIRIEDYERKIAGEGSAAKRVAAFLRDVLQREGLDANDAIGRMEAAWSSWLHAEQMGHVVVERWDQPFNLPGGARFAYLDPLEFSATQEILREAQLLIMGQSAYRGDITALLQEARVGGSMSERAELDRIELWTRRVRHYAIARQHDCAFRYALRDSADPAEGRVAALSDEIESLAADNHQLPSGFIRRLGRLPVEEFQRSISTEVLGRWWNTRDPSSLRRVIESVVSAVEGSIPENDRSRRDNYKTLELFIEFGGVALGAGAGAIVGGLPGISLGALGGTWAGKLVAGYGLPNVKGSLRQQTVRQLIEYCSDDRRPAP